jgi:hypothetical protein
MRKHLIALAEQTRLDRDCWLIEFYSLEIFQPTSPRSSRLSFERPISMTPTQKPTTIKPMIVYLLHFHQKLAHGQHYIGFTTNLDKRLTDHLCCQGARLMAAYECECR